MLSGRPIDTRPLKTAFADRFGISPEIETEQVTAAQCPALDFVGTLQGRAEPAPVLSLDSNRMISGGAIAGRLREARGRPLWLFLVEPGGGIHDLSSRAVAQADGSFVFSFALASAVAQTSTPHLVVALASREPLVAPAVAPAGAPSEDLLKRVMEEIASGGGFASADIAYFKIEPAD